MGHFSELASMYQQRCGFQVGRDGAGGVALSLES